MNLEYLKDEVESWLRDYFKDKGAYNKKIYEAMEYSLNVGGKRIRPLLLLATYMMYDSTYKKVLPVCSALEMIHTYSLIHDDLPCMDNDDLRRGQPTNHKVFGEGIAVLAGDGLLNEAMNVLFHFSLQGRQNELTASALLSEAAGPEGMIGGQIVDLLSENKKISTDELYYMHEKKTGALIKAAILAGAILGGSPAEELGKLEQFGEKLGLAFQIKDDILDIIGDTKILGKNTGSDLANEKTTFISAFGIEKCNEMCAKLTEDCLEILQGFTRNTEMLKDITKMLLQRNH